jgi:16S rRNA G1207 methylase RsmC
VEGAFAALAPGGLFALVAKAGPQHAEHVEAVFGNASIDACDGYAIVSATRD